MCTFLQPRQVIATSTLRDVNQLVGNGQSTAVTLLIQKVKQELGMCLSL